MFYEKLLDAIHKFFPADPLKDIEIPLRELNPDKIYLENVRNLLHVSSEKALKVIDHAVRQGLLSKYVEVLCPDGSVAYTATSENDLPDHVKCWVEENNAYAVSTLPTVELNKLVFYKYNG
jgi:hypothetical protein